MPRITTDSGNTLDDVLTQPDLFAPRVTEYCYVRYRFSDRRYEMVDDLLAVSTDERVLEVTLFPDGTAQCRTLSHWIISDEARVGITRRGDSIVPLAVGDSIEFSGFRHGFPPNGKFTVKGVTTIPASHRSDPHTSKTAAASVVQTASRHRELILQALKEIGPSTGHELAARLGLEYVQVAKRLTELAADEKIQRRVIAWTDIKGPTYQTRPSPSGRPACVWHLNPLKS